MADVRAYNVGTGLEESGYLFFDEDPNTPGVTAGVGSVAATDIAVDDPLLEYPHPYEIPGIDGVELSTDAGVNWGVEGHPITLPDVTSTPRRLHMRTAQALSQGRTLFLPKVTLEAVQSSISLGTGTDRGQGVDSGALVGTMVLGTGTDVGIGRDTGSNALTARNPAVAIGGGTDRGTATDSGALQLIRALLGAGTDTGVGTDSGSMLPAASDHYLTSDTYGSCYWMSKVANSSSQWSESNSADAPSIRIAIGAVNGTGTGRTFTESDYEVYYVTQGYSGALPDIPMLTTLPTIGESDRFCVRVQIRNDTDTDWKAAKDFLLPPYVGVTGGVKVVLYVSENVGSLTVRGGSASYPSKATFVGVDNYEQSWDFTDDFNRASLGSNWVLHEYTDSTNEMDFATVDSLYLTTGSDYTEAKWNRLHVASGIMASSTTDQYVAVKAVDQVTSTTPRVSVVARHNGATDDAAAQYCYNAQMLVSGSSNRIIIGKSSTPNNTIASFAAGSSDFTLTSNFVTGWTFAAGDELMLGVTGSSTVTVKVWVRKAGDYWRLAITGTDTDADSRILTGVAALASYAAAGVSSAMRFDDFRVAIP